MSLTSVNLEREIQYNTKQCRLKLDFRHRSTRFLSWPVRLTVKVRLQVSQAVDGNSSKLRVLKPTTNGASSQSSSASAREVKKRVPRINASQAITTSHNQTGLLSSRAIVAAGFRIRFLLPLRRRTILRTITTAGPHSLPRRLFLVCLHIGRSLHPLDQTRRECPLPRTGMRTWMRRVVNAQFP